MNDSLVLRDLIQAKKSLKNAVKKLHNAGEITSAIRLKSAISSIDRTILIVRTAGNKK
jgi:hypothetical protein